MLAFYARQLAAVEINNTFYRLPRPALLQQWTAQVPDDFSFSLKASRSITHFRRLKDAEMPLHLLIENADVLGPARGPILFQLPPNMKLDLDRLNAFLELLPPATRAAFEFRHPSWHVTAVHDTLRQSGVALCIADSADNETPFVPTAEWGYIRLRRELYDEADLSRWADRIRDTAWTDVFAFFKHEDAGSGPRLAARFQALFDNR